MMARKCCKSIRWAFNYSEWKPTQEQWKTALQCVQKEEMDRINRFVYVDDCKASLVGQLLMRKAVSEALPYDDFTFSRTESGKPFIVGEDTLSFNVSHHGDFCVLAAETDFDVGVDVMRVEPRGRKSTSEFFTTMQRQFSVSEWDFITMPSTEKTQLQRFYRLWCLKESYVKATGTGIARDLRSLSFYCPTFTLQESAVTTDTQLYVEGILESEWKFEESVLDSVHYATVAMRLKSGNSNDATTQDQPARFLFLSFDELMRHAIPFEAVDKNYWHTFCLKEKKFKI